MKGDVNLNTAEITEINPETAKTMIEDISTYIALLDVRNPEDFVSGHIKNAISMPVKTIKRSAKELLPDLSQEIIVYCNNEICGKEAVCLLSNLGYTNIFNMGSIKNWTYDIVK